MTYKTKKAGAATVPARQLLQTIRDPEAHELMKRVHRVFGRTDVTGVKDTQMALHLDRFNCLVEDWLYLFKHPEQLDESLMGIGWADTDDHQ